MIIATPGLGNGSLFVCSTINVILMMSNCQSATNNRSSMIFSLVVVSAINYILIFILIIIIITLDFCADSPEPGQQFPHRKERSARETLFLLSLLTLSTTTSAKPRTWTRTRSLSQLSFSKLKHHFRQQFYWYRTARLIISKSFPWCSGSLLWTP